MKRDLLGEKFRWKLRNHRGGVNGSLSGNHRIKPTGNAVDYNYSERHK
jgi:hypothetical protein